MLYFLISSSNSFLLTITQDRDYRHHLLSSSGPLFIKNAHQPIFNLLESPEPALSLWFDSFEWKCNKLWVNKWFSMKLAIGNRNLIEVVAFNWNPNMRVIGTKSRQVMEPEFSWVCCASVYLPVCNFLLLLKLSSSFYISMQAA